MKVEDYFAQGKDPPLLRLLLQTIDDEKIFSRHFADVEVEPEKLARGSDGRLYMEERPSGVLPR